MRETLITIGLAICCFNVVFMIWACWRYNKTKNNEKGD